MKLTKALKLKNRLAGEVQRLSALLLTCNSWEEGQEPQFDAEVVHGELIAAISKLVEVKKAIAAANAGMVPGAGKSNYANIFLMAELKGVVETFGNLPTRHGIVRESSFRGDPIERKFRSRIGEVAKATRIKELQNEIDGLQDEIDEYNALTDIVAINGIVA